MKFILIISVLSLSTYCTQQVKNSKNNTTKNSVINENKPSVSNEKDTGLIGINSINTSYQTFEKSIEESIHIMFLNKNTMAVDDKIKTINLDISITESQKTYWNTYLNYYKSIFYKSILNDDNQAKKNIDNALELISEKPITSEDYALLAAIQSYSIQFANMTKISKIAAKADEYALKSLALNKGNLRAYLVLATQNFHTPKMFGGMKKVEDYALKGLACNDSLDKDYYSPNWGRKRLYELLIQFYELENRMDDLRKLKNKYNDKKY